MFILIFLCKIYYKLELDKILFYLIQVYLAIKYYFTRDFRREKLKLRFLLYDVQITQLQIAFHCEIFAIVRKNILIIFVI